MAETDLADLRKQCITSLYLCSDNISKFLDDDKEAEFAKLKSYVEDYCRLESQQEVAIQALDRAKRETDVSNVDTLQERFDSNMQSLANNVNVNKHPYMVEIQKRIHKGMQEPKNNLDQSDMAITETDNRPIDPITKRPIEDPVKNKLCGHVYDRASIMNLLNLRNKKIKCPVVGCGNKTPIIPSHLISDEELRFQMSLNTHSTMIQEPLLDLDDSD